MRSMGEYPSDDHGASAGRLDPLGTLDYDNFEPARCAKQHEVHSPQQPRTAAMAYSTVVTRHRTREVGVGDHMVGGNNPIWVQSMTTTNTFDAEATLEQIRRLEEAGCEIV